jgi:hypothetical protein
MPIEILTYVDLAARLNISPEGARSLVKRLRLPRSLSSDGKALVSVDLAEIRHTPRSPGPRKVKIETLQAEITRLEAAAAVHRADFERERERGDRLMVELLNTTAEIVSANKAAARLEGELAALRTGGRGQVPSRIRDLAASVVEADRRANVTGE